MVNKGVLQGMNFLFNFRKILNFLVVLFLFVPTICFAEKTGEDIYKSFCITCHSPQMAKIFQAPAAHSDDWVIRKLFHLNSLSLKDSSIKLKDNSVKENLIIDSLVLSATKGTPNGMPPKGTCTDCSADELRNAILYMISAV